MKRGLVLPAEVRAIPRLAEDILYRVALIERQRAERRAAQPSQDALQLHVAGFLRHWEGLYRSLQGILGEEPLYAFFEIGGKEIDEARAELLRWLPEPFHSGFARGHNLVELQAVLLGARQKVRAIERLVKRRRGARHAWEECALHEFIARELKRHKISRVASDATLDQVFGHLSLKRPTAPTLRAYRRQQAEMHRRAMENK